MDPQPLTPLITYRNMPIPHAIPIMEDSYLLPSFVQNPEALYDALSQQAHWTNPEDPEMRYRGNELNRQKAFFVKSPESEPDLDSPLDVLYKYGYPGFQYLSMLHYRPFQLVPLMYDLIRDLEGNLCYNEQPISINHAIATNYRDGEDGIGMHTDKMKDIRPNTPIISISMNETREMALYTLDGTYEQTIVLRSGDLFILGPQTNARHKHAIVKVADERVLQRDPTMPIRPRISIVFRDIHTQISLSAVMDKIERGQRQKRARGE